MQNNVEQTKKNNYPTFKDVEDTNVRTYNQATTMVNIFEDYGDGKKSTSQRGLALILRYFKDNVKYEDRERVKDINREVMRVRGLLA